MINSKFAQNGVVRFKLRIIILLLTYFPCVFVNAQTNVTLTIDYSLTSSEPDAIIKRGYILRDAIVLKNNNVLADLDTVASLNCGIVNLPRDLNQFNPGYDPVLKNYYKSYRSNTNTQYFGADGQVEEFRKVNGNLAVSVNSNFLDICNRAKADGLQMLIQASGTPVQGNSDGSVTQMFNLDTTRQFQNSARFYAFPASSDYSAVANALVNWMSIIRSNTGDSTIIWAGHQEPSHTAGYPNGVQTTLGTMNNVSDYVTIWKPIATKIKNQNLGMVADIQLNEAYADYSNGINKIASKNVPIDYFSIQNYKGENNKTVIDTAFQNLSANGLGTKKIVFDRYDFDAGFSTVQSRYNSAAGMTQFLKNELVLLNNADKMYGYCLFTGAMHQSMMNEVMKFLNTMPVSRRDITGIGQGINAWCTANGKDFYMALWNTATGSRSVTINLNNFPVAYNTSQMNIRKASDTTLSNYGNATWTPGTASTINNIILEQNTFVLIKLDVPQNPTITFNNSTKTYGNAAFNVAATSNSPGAITYSITSGSQYAAITSGGQVTIKGAGTVTIQASQAASPGYNAGTSTAILTINKATLTATADNKSKIYNTVNPTLTISYSGFVNGETSSVLTSEPTISCAATQSSDAGSYPITLSRGAAANYNLQLVNGTFIILQGTPIVTYTGSTSGNQGTSISVSATSNSDGTISYSLANGTGTASLSGTTLSLTASGTVTLSVNVAATTDYAAASITQIITIDGATGTTPYQIIDNSLEVYPNPTSTSDYVYVKINTGQDNVGDLILYNAEGSIVQKVAEGIIGKNVYSIPVSDLSSGIYILKLQTEKGIFIKKLTK
jgi:hypothetical protein